MLFNSYAFLGVFLPITLVVYFTLAWSGRDRAAILWLLVASLAFYSWWEPAHLPLLVGTILFNYWLGAVLQSRFHAGGSGSRLPLALGVGVNLALLGAFKYSAFVLNEAATLAGLDFTMRAMVLPLGISFFTFQQIAYLVDSARGRAAPSSFVEYALFVAYFPQLIAGPIVHHSEVLHQFRTILSDRINSENFARGLSFLYIGLFKKVVVADNLAKIADPLFAGPGGWMSASAIEAWTGTLAYTFQIYFDFSGYSDMAIGLALMCGIRLPYNFDSPYKAVSIIDFWRRWHMTLSRFLRDYLYVSLGGNRRGRARRYVNLMITMLLGGLWHGANWTFLVWGAIHGFYLIVNHVPRALRPRLGLPAVDNFATRALARTLTLLAVMLAWVFFRAPSLEGAFDILLALGGANGLGSPSASIAVVTLVAVAWTLPNSQEFVDDARKVGRSPLRWRPNGVVAAALAGCLILSISQMSKVSAFIYFQF